MPATAFAAGTGKAIQLGASNISGYDSTSDSYDYIYMGNYNDKPIKWRVLDADKANDGSTAGMFCCRNICSQAVFSLKPHGLKMTEMDRPIQMSGSIATHSSGAQTFTATIFP